MDGWPSGSQIPSHHQLEHHHSIYQYLQTDLINQVCVRTQNCIFPVKRVRSISLQHLAIMLFSLYFIYLSGLVPLMLPICDQSLQTMQTVFLKLMYLMFPASSMLMTLLCHFRHKTWEASFLKLLFLVSESYSLPENSSFLFHYSSHKFSNVFLHPAAEEHNQKDLFQLRFIT